MAKIQFTAAIGDMRGSIGGVVATANYAGAFLRSKTSARKSATSPQQAIRGNLYSQSKAWSDILTAAERANWIAWAGTYSRPEMFNPTQYLTGLQFFLGANQALKQIGRGPITDTAGTWTVGAPSGCVLVWDDVLRTLTVNGAVGPGADDVPTIFATPMVRAGRASTKSLQRSLTYADAGLPGPWDISDVYQTKFGTFIEGRGIFIKLLYTNQNNGCQSAYSVNSVLLAPPP